MAYAAEAARQVPDRQILEAAAAENRLMLTEDKDFGELVFRDGFKSAGVVLLRMNAQRWPFKWTRLLGLILSEGDELHRRFTVIEQDGIRTQILQS